MGSQQSFIFRPPCQPPKCLLTPRNHEKNDRQTRLQSAHEVRTSEFEDLTLLADGSDVLIDFSEHGGGSVRLTGVELGDLDAADFHFHTPDPTDTHVM